MMDNCLAPSCETGGVGCDNMTIVIIALLRGKTLEEWYNMVAERVAQGEGPCAPPEYGMPHSEFLICLSPLTTTAEKKPPGTRARFSRNSDSDDPDGDVHDSASHQFLGGGSSGRIIMLGDGTEVMTDSGDQDADMFDQSEDEDLEVTKGQTVTDAAESRSSREKTPGPTGDGSVPADKSEDAASIAKPETASLQSTPADEPKMMAASDSIPDKDLKKTE